MMGITGLKTALSKHGEQKTFVRDYALRLAIIDGPNLVHELYHKKKGRSYKDLAERVIEWLNLLEHCGFQIEAILFDGAVPVSKRRKRQEQKAGWSPSFLIPAIRDALVRSPFAGVIYTVPGEADPFCIAAGKETVSTDQNSKVYIFSGDTDLLLYDSPERVHIISTKGFEEYVDRKTGGLLGIEYCPHKMAESMNLTTEDLVKPAYYFSKYSYDDWEKAIRDSQKKDIEWNEKFVAFRSAYRTIDEGETWEELKNDTSRQEKLSQFDVRVSELIHQIKPGPDRFRPKSNQKLHVYLPYFFVGGDEAWNACKSIRDLAYTMIVKGLGMNEPVFEYSSGYQGSQVDLEDDGEFNARANRVATYLETLVGDHEELDPVDIWKAICIHTTLVMMHQIHKNMTEEDQKEGWETPSKDKIIRVMTETYWTGTGDDGLTPVPQIYQAIFYSFRMLYQATLLDEAVEWARQLGAEDSVSRLQSVLSQQPSIPDFFQPGEYINLEKEKWMTFGQNHLDWEKPVRAPVSNPYAGMTEDEMLEAMERDVIEEKSREAEMNMK